MILDSNVVVVGDVLRDIYVTSRVARLSPESPNVVIEAGETDQGPGGAGIGASTLSNLGVKVVLASAWDTPFGQLLHGLGHEAMLNLVPGHRVAEKTRYLSAGIIVARVDQEGAALSRRSISAKALTTLSREMQRASSIVVADYGQSAALAIPGVVREVASSAKRVPVIWDFHPRSSSFPPPSCLVKFNRNDFDTLVSDPRRSANIGSIARKLLVEHGWQGILVTEGAAGATFIDADNSYEIACASFPARNAIGAGDMVTAFWAAFAAEAPGPASAARAVRVASLALAIREGALDAVSPGVDPQELSLATRGIGRRLVIASGCFDVLHAGHIDLLREARNLGDVLIVLVNSDPSVSRLKGPGRPVCRIQDRTAVLQQLRGVGAVAVFDEDTPARALATLKPHAYVKGGDYVAEDLPEATQLNELGAEIHIIPRTRDLSSSSILERNFH